MSWNQRRRLSFLGLRSIHDSEPGFSLIEVLVALGILAAVAVIFLLGMTISSRATIVSQEAVAADSLAKSQMEIIKSWGYDDVNNPPDYAAAKLTDIPTGYDISIGATRMDPKGDGYDEDDGMQKITIHITHNEETALIMIGYKVR